MAPSEFAVLASNPSNVALVIRDIHLIAVIFCLTLAVSADIRAAKFLFLAPSDNDIDVLKRFHHILTLSLVVLWVTGLFLTYDVTAGELANVSPKLVTKYVVILILTLNAFLIGRYAMPIMESMQLERLGDLPPGQRYIICAMSSVSFVSWISALCLGAITSLKTYPAEALLWTFGLAYLVAFALGPLLAAFAGALAACLPAAGQCVVNNTHVIVAGRGVMARDMASSRASPL